MTAISMFNPAPSTPESVSTKNEILFSLIGIYMEYIMKSDFCFEYGDEQVVACELFEMGYTRKKLCRIIAKNRVNRKLNRFIESLLERV